MAKLILILAGVIILLGALSFILILVIKDNLKQIKDLKHDNKALEDNIIYLYKYSEVIAKIKKEKKEVTNEILQAKTTEEVIEIIDNLIKYNNSRL